MLLKKAETRFGVVAPATGIICCCTKCSKPFAKGAAMIEVQIVGDPNTYTLASSKKITCCGEDKAVDELFDSAEEAESMVQMIERGADANGVVNIVLNSWGQLQHDGSTKPLLRPEE